MEIRFEVETDFEEVRGLHLSAFAAIGEGNLMALALQDDGLPVTSGAVSYAPAFDGLD